MLVLPNNLSSVAKCVAKDCGRYSMVGIRVSERPEGQYRVEATDGRKLIRVEGHNAVDPAYFASVDKLTTAPNSATAATIGLEQFKGAMSAAKASKSNRNNDLAQSVAVVLSDNVSTLAVIAPGQETVSQPANVEGRFPDTDAPGLFPTGEPTARVQLTAKHLTDLVASLAPFAADDSVSLELFCEPGSVQSIKPVVFRCQNEKQSAVGLLMCRSA